MTGEAAKNIDAMSDDEFLREFAEHEAELASAPRQIKVSDPGVQGETQPSGKGKKEDTGSQETDGADPGEQSSNDPYAGKGRTSEEGKGEEGNAEPSSDNDDAREDPHQGASTSDDNSDDESKATKSPEAGDELAQLMAPLKASGRTIKLESVDKARQLMQMGVDYSTKMRDLKPFQKVFKTLERANLLEEDKLNFLIDLSNKQPDAIRKLLKDSEIDPLDLDLEESGDYKPNNHMIPDGELALDAVLDDLRPSPQFDKAVDIISGWDMASKRSLMDEPNVLRHITAHLEAGIYEMIMDRLENDRVFGKYVGLSDLDAYRAVGDAMYEEGAFGKANPSATSATGTSDQGHSQDSQGSPESIKARKRAASSPKGSASPAKKTMPDFAKMSDKEIEEFDWRSSLT